MRPRPDRRNQAKSCKSETHAIVCSQLCLMPPRHASPHLPPGTLSSSPAQNFTHPSPAIGPSLSQPYLPSLLVHSSPHPALRG